MSADLRDALEDILSTRFTPAPHGRDVAHQENAMFAWLMVQSARLRVLSPTAMSCIRDNALIQLEGRGFSPDARLNFSGPSAQQARLAAEAPYRNAHDASARPEYATALNNFLKYLNPLEPLHPRVRGQVKAAFNHQRTTERRISPQVEAMVARHGIETLAREGYRIDHTGAFNSAAERAGFARVAPSAPPEELMHSEPASSRQGRRLARSDSSLSQQSDADAHGWIARQAGRDLAR